MKSSHQTGTLYRSAFELQGQRGDVSPELDGAEQIRDASIEFGDLALKACLFQHLVGVVLVGGQHRGRDDASEPFVEARKDGVFANVGRQWMILEGWCQGAVVADAAPIEHTP